MSYEGMPVERMETKKKSVEFELPKGIAPDNVIVAIYAKSHDLDGKPSEKEVGDFSGFVNGKYVFTYHDGSVEKSVSVEVKDSKIFVSGEVDKTGVSNEGLLEISIPETYEQVMGE